MRGEVSLRLMPIRRAIALASLLLALFGAAIARAAELTVHFLDVGQGDAILIVSPSGKTVLVDAGPPQAAGRLARRLRELVHEPLDLAILTHPHADHVGGMKRSIEAVGARLFLDPGASHGSPLYEALLRSLEAWRIPVKIAKAGRTIDLGGGASLHLLGPLDPPLAGTRSDVNANCVVARLVFGKTAVYLAGDSELETERRILASGEIIRSDVYKVAHHGSRFSSSAGLLTRVQPSVAVISAGAHNDYGHPSERALSRLASYGARVYRTDRDGEITVSSDGEAIRVTTGAARIEQASPKRPGHRRERHHRLHDEAPGDGELPNRGRSDGDAQGALEQRPADRALAAGGPAAQSAVP